MEDRGRRETHRGVRPGRRDTANLRIAAVHGERRASANADALSVVAVVGGGPPDGGAGGGDVVSSVSSSFFLSFSGIAKAHVAASRR